MCLFLLGWRSGAYHFGSLWPWHWLLASFLGLSCLENISYITANFPQMCLMLDQFLWGHLSRDCDISCFLLKVDMLHIKLKWKKCRPTCKVTLWIYTHPWPLGLGLKVIYGNCADASIFFFIKLSTKTYLTCICYDLNNTEGELRAR